MDGFVVSGTRWMTVVICAGFLAMVACKNDQHQPAGQADPQVVTNQSTGRSDANPGLDGNTILQRVLDEYSVATTYQDHGVLYLRYRLKGQYIEEPQRWSTTFDRAGNRLAVEVFNSRIRGDGNLMSCFVFDIETANLNNQHRLTAYEGQLPIDQLYRDTIARRFLGGYSELPLDETLTTSAASLIPAPISLLTQQVRSSWLQTPERVEYLADETIDEVRCYVVRCLANDMTTDVWIAQDSSLIIQMSLPLKLLAGEVITTPDEITEVVLLARFHDARIGANVTDAMFELPLHDDATPVKKFVPLPESFPTEMIGRQAPDFRFLTPSGETRTKLDFKGKVTALLWVAGTASYTAMQQLSDIASELPQDQFHLASVYSEPELKQPGSGSYQTNDVFRQASEAAKLPVYYDRDLAASSALGIKVIPSVIVMDAEMKVHFSCALSDTSWSTKTKAAIKRVANGDNVASEMQAEYQRYIASYHQQLETVSAADLLEQAHRLNPEADDATTQVRFTKIWANSEFQQSGNLVVVDAADPDGARYLAFDGWQTIVALSPSGQTVARHQLVLPSNDGTSLIRVGVSRGKPLYALFGPLGKQVHLFDHAWNPMGVYPNGSVNRQKPAASAETAEPNGVKDCLFVDLDADGESELVVSFQGDGGAHVVDPVTGKSESAFELPATSLASLGEDLAICTGGRIVKFKTGHSTERKIAVDFRRIGSFDNAQLCGIGTLSAGQWQAIGLDRSLNRHWTLAVGSQYFDTAIEPIAATGTANGDCLWAVADADNVIHLISGGGKWLGDLQSPSPLAGLGLVTINGQTRLIVSNQTGVECWNLELPK